MVSHSPLQLRFPQRFLGHLNTRILQFRILFSHPFGILFLHRFQSCFHTRNGLIYAKIMHSHFLFNVMDGFIYSSYLYVPRWDLPRKAAWQGIIFGKRRRRGERNGCTTEVMNKGRVI